MQAGNLRPSASASGIAFIVVSAFAFGAMAIFARFAYAGGANVTGVLAARFALAGLVLAVLMIATRRPWPRGRPLAVAIGMGAVGYVGYSGNMGRAAKSLGIHRNTLRAKISLLEIRPGRRRGNG